MNTAHSTARPTHEYQPTVIESRFLISRLATQLTFLREELKRSWTQFKENPVNFFTCLIREVISRLKQFLSTPYALRSSSTAIIVVTSIVAVALLIESTASKPDPEVIEPPVEMLVINFEKPNSAQDDSGIGKNGTGRVGFQDEGGGEGSGPTQQSAQGGGSGGDRNPLPPQVGEVPPPSAIPAAIPITPPLNPPALPAAGIDIDPALWQDLKAPVYGDPFSKSAIPSAGPGVDGGIGTNKGTGIGVGLGPGVGPGTDGNMGTGPKQTGCCGSGGSTREGGPNGDGGPLSITQVEQRARLLFKPEPQYTEEARRNQITGTVVLRVVFSSAGQVVQIRAVRTLPFGLTERAVVAARQIKFVPAMKGGRPVSVHMQLEYNFNLY